MTIYIIRNCNAGITIKICPLVIGYWFCAAKMKVKAALILKNDLRSHVGVNGITITTYKVVIIYQKFGCPIKTSYPGIYSPRSISNDAPKLNAQSRKVFC